MGFPTNATLVAFALSAGIAAAAEKEMLITKDFLNYPVAEAGMLTAVRLEVAGKEVLSQPTCFATGEPTFWFHLDVRPFKGKKVTLVVGKPGQAVPGIERVYQADEFAGQQTLYRERWRPQFHFTPQYGYVPIFALFDLEQRSVQAAVTEGTCVIERLTVNTLKSIWGELDDGGAGQAPK